MRHKVILPTVSTFIPKTKLMLPGAHFFILDNPGAFGKRMSKPTCATLSFVK